jgi:hypothetical protein
MNPHVHVSAIEGVKITLIALIGIGVLHIAARKFEGHPLADAFLNVYC